MHVLINVAKQSASVLFYSLRLIKLKQVIELTLNHERKRDNPFNLCSDKKLCDLAALRLKKGNGFIWFLFLQDTNNNLSRILRKFEKLGIDNQDKPRDNYLTRLPKISRVSSFVMVRVAALVAFLATRPVVEVLDLVFLPVTLSLT